MRESPSIAKISLLQDVMSFFSNIFDEKQKCPAVYEAFKVN